jgi:tRNA(Ile)-lysidine synthase
MHSIPFVEDSSNEKVVYERNFIRKYITPLMEELNPAFREKIFLLLQDLTSINDLFEKKAEEFMKKEVWFEEGDIHLKAEGLKNTDEETRFRVIAHLLTQIAPAFIPLREHLHLIEKIIMGSKPNLSVILPKGIMAKKVYDELIFTQKPSVTVIKDILPVKAGKNILKPFGLSLDVSQFHDKRIEFQSDRNVAFFDKDKTGSLYVRTFLEGDRFFPLGMKDSIKLKDFFISQKIPKEKRRHIPLLISGRDIIWIIGYRIDERYKVAEDTRNILKIVARTYQ